MSSPPETAHRRAASGLDYVHDRLGLRETGRTMLHVDGDEIHPVVSEDVGHGGRGGLKPRAEHGLACL
jgi:hypothetical protein